MTPCMRLYAHLGQSLAVEGVAADSAYGSWVTAYADPAFGILADQLEALLDAHADDTPAVRAAYGRAMRLEVAFFDAAYTLDAAPALMTSLHRPRAPADHPARRPSGHVETCLATAAH